MQFHQALSIDLSLFFDFGCNCFAMVCNYVSLHLINCHTHIEILMPINGRFTTGHWRSYISPCHWNVAYTFVMATEQHDLHNWYTTNTQ